MKEGRRGVYRGRIEMTWVPLTSGRKRVPSTTTTLAAQQRVLSPTPERRRARSFGIREERLGLCVFYLYQLWVG